MKFTTFLLLTASIVCSSWAYPAGGHPDDDVEVIAGGNQPGYQPTPSDPSIPHYPLVPTIPSIPTVPVYPSYPYPTYPSYPTYPTYFPVGWTYNVFDGFSNFFSQIRDQASTAWSRMPSIRPMINNYWPDVKSNGTTTSTVKVVGDHKFIINETVHVQQSDFGHVVYKMRTVDVKPVEPNDETTEGVEDETTAGPEGGIDVPNTSNPANTPENGSDDDDDRVSIADTGDIDDNRGSPEVFDEDNEIAGGTIEQFEVNTSSSSNNGNEIEKQSMLMDKNEKIEIESLSVETEDNKSNEWSGIEFENNDDQKNTYYEVNNNQNSNSGEEVTHDLTNDIAINQMLADQGAAHDPDAEVFNIHQYEVERGAAEVLSQEQKESQPESFDYLPYHHQTVDKQPTAIK